MSVLEANPEYESIGSKFFEREEKEMYKKLETVKARAENEGVSCEIEVLHVDDSAVAIVNEAFEKKTDSPRIQKHTGRHGRLTHGNAAVNEAITIAKRCRSRLIALSSDA